MGSTRFEHIETTHPESDRGQTSTARPLHVLEPPHFPEGGGKAMVFAFLDFSVGHLPHEPDCKSWDSAVSSDLITGYHWDYIGQEQHLRCPTCGRPSRSNLLLQADLSVHQSATSGSHHRVDGVLHKPRRSITNSEIQPRSLNLKKSLQRLSKSTPPSCHSASTIHVGLFNLQATDSTDVR